MMRTLLILIGGFLSVALAYTLLFTGGRAHGHGFRAGSIYVEYEVNAPGAVRPERLEYLVLSLGHPEEQSVRSADDSPTTFTRTYREVAGTNTVSFSTKPGQTVWIGKDRKVVIVTPPLSMSDVQLLEKNRANEALQGVLSLQELQMVIAKLKAEPSTAPNAAPPQR